MSSRKVLIIFRERVTRRFWRAGRSGWGWDAESQWRGVRSFPSAGWENCSSKEVMVALRGEANDLIASGGWKGREGLGWLEGDRGLSAPLFLLPSSPLRTPCLDPPRALHSRDPARGTAGKGIAEIHLPVSVRPPARILWGFVPLFQTRNGKGPPHPRCRTVGHVD